MRVAPAPQKTTRERTRRARERYLSPTMRGAVLCCQPPAAAAALAPPSSLHRSSRGRRPVGSLSVSTVAPETEVSDEASPRSAVRRRLILLRHAESSWADRSVRDHDRPLSKAGRSDATKIARRLQEMGWVPDLILSSDAARTRETLQIMREHAAGFLAAEVQYVPSFYSVAAMDGQTAEHLQKIVCECSRDEILSVMCMGHNKGWEEAASMFSGASIELKTCNAALLEANGESWKEAFASAGLGGWKLHGIVKPDSMS